MVCYCTYARPQSKNAAEEQEREEAAREYIDPEAFDFSAEPQEFYVDIEVFYLFNSRRLVLCVLRRLC